MKKSVSTPQIGQIVSIKKGRDAGQFAIVIHHIDERFVYIVDGDKRKFDRPKKKNIQHLKCYDYISFEVQQSMAGTGRITNKTLRWILGKFMDESLEVLEKGDGFNGERRRN